MFPSIRTCCAVAAIGFLLSMMPTLSHARPIVIAHRGASAYVPEHTLLAVTAAHIMGADYIEQDIVLSADGVPVVLHDIHLEPTTDVAERFPEREREDGHYYALDFTLEELKSLSVVERRGADGRAAFSDRFPERALGLRIPTLAEEIELIEGLNRTRPHQAGYYIELKAPDFHRREGHDIASAVLNVLDRYALNHSQAKVMLQCFHDGTLKQLHESEVTPLPLIQLIGENDWGEDGGVDYDAMRTPAGLDRVAEYADGIGPWIPQLFEADGLTPSPLVAAAHERGLMVHPYTLRADALSLDADSFEELQRRVFMAAGVDGAFSDHADLTLHFLDRHFTAQSDMAAPEPINHIRP